MVDFPVNFMIRILSIWMKIIPFSASIAEGYTKEDIQVIGATKVAIRDFSTNVVTHLQHMVDYLRSIKQHAPLNTKFKHIKQDPIYKELKSTFLAGQHIFLIPQKIEENFLNNANKMNTDYEGVIQTTIEKLEERIKLVVQLMDN